MSPAAYDSQLLAGNGGVVTVSVDSKQLEKRASGINSHFLGTGDDSSFLSLKLPERSANTQSEVWTDLSLQLPGGDTQLSRPPAELSNGLPTEGFSLPEPNAQAGSSTIESKGKGKREAYNEARKRKLEKLKQDASNPNLPIDKQLKAQAELDKLRGSDAMRQEKRRNTPAYKERVAKQDRKSVV